MATSCNWSTSTKEHSNFARLCRLLIDGGTLVVKDVFDSIHPPKTLRRVLLEPSVHGKLKLLRTKRVLNTHQWNKLYPSVRSSVTSSNFDITLLIVLLRNICGLTPPTTGWDNLPPATDTSRQADLARIKWYRNQLYGHITTTSISDADFEKYWNDIEALLSRLSANRYQDDLRRLKVETMEPEDEKHFVKAIEEWEQMEQRIMSKLDEVISMLKSTSSVADDSRCKDYTEKLKSSIKSQTDFQPGLKEGKRIKTDDIFTNVTIQRGQKQLRKQQTEEGTNRKGTVDQGNDSFDGHSILNKCSEIFTFPVKSDAQASNENTYPKSILVTGQAGIGKTIFAQKLVRDWASDILFDEDESKEHPDFQFVFLLTFRQLNLLDEKEFNLRELLNRSSLLNEQSNLDDALFEYLLQNPQKMLLIIDGYDEYSHDKEVDGDSELKYPNDPKEKMPIPILVAKLLKGRILQDSVVMITSRPGNQVHDLRENFDVQVEITGFSYSQVLQFVEKYFKNNERMKNTVLDHFRQHEHMFEFVHVPVICLLMCYFLEWHLTHSESPVKLPVTRTELYHEVTKVFIRKHHLHLKYAKKEEADQVVDKALGKLAELAAKMLGKKKYIFDEEDLSKLKFCKEEIDNLKTSGVLYCCPGTRKSSFAEVTHEYAFLHLTVQEYLAAYCFVERGRIRKTGSDMLFQFMSGLLAKKKDKELMTELLNSIKPDKQNGRGLRLAKCLWEYKETTFAKEYISEHFVEFCYDGYFSFYSLNDSNSVYSITFVLDVLTQLHEEQLQCSQPFGTQRQPFYVEIFEIERSYLTATGVRRIIRSLTNISCTVTNLKLEHCRIQDDWVETMHDLLISGKLLELNLRLNFIADKGVIGICESLTNENCKLTNLNLNANKLTDKGVSSICELLTDKHCKLTTLDLGSNFMTDKEMISISESLSHKNCKLTNLYLRANQFTDKGVSSICESLKNENCKLTTLDLSANQFTDKGVSSICESLKNENCKLTSLGLCYNKITDKRVSSICESLTNESCKLTTLDLHENKITDKGVSSICESLTNENCKLTNLELSYNKFTDKNVPSICESLTNENCKLTALNLLGNNLSDEGATSVFQSVMHENCRLRKLGLRRPSNDDLLNRMKREKPQLMLRTSCDRSVCLVSYT